MRRALHNWMSRHQNPVSFWLHMLGIPMTIIAIPLAIKTWYLVAVAMFIAGYALQFIGHAIEGNRSGEAMLIRRLLGLSNDDTADKPIHRRHRPR